MSAQLIESSPVEPLVVGVHLYPGDTWFREVQVRSVMTQAPVDLSGWVFEARLGEHVGAVDASRADEGRLAVEFTPEQTADAEWGDTVTVSGLLAGGRRTFLHGVVGAAVGSSIPVGPAQKTRVVSSDVDISVYAAPRGDKGADGSAVSVALVQRAEGAEGRAVAAADDAEGFASSARTDAGLATAAAASADTSADESAESARVALSASQGIVAARDAAAASAADADADADRAGTSAFSAAGSAAAAQSSEDDARGFRDAAEGFKTAAETARGGAEQARDLALAGQFLGSGLTSANDLNVITTPGVYRCGSGAFATTANNYPASGVAGVLTVTQWGGTGQVVQRYTPYPSTGTPNIIIGEWIRAYRGSAFSAWRFMASQRINNPAGQPGVEPFTFDDTSNRELALTPASIELGTVDLNAVTLAGSYRQRTPAEATTARNYPIANARVVLEVIPIESNLLEQRLTIVQGHTSAMRGHYVRRNAYGTWEPWVFFASQRVDQTAGRAIYTWDDVAGREQLIYGDTGWRNVTNDLVNQFGVTSSFALRRVGNRVIYYIEGITRGAGSPSQVAYVAPAGFKPFTSSGSARGLLHTASSPVTAYRVRADNNNPDVNIDVPIGGPALYGTVEWITHDAWPSVLPGVAVGGVPNA